jgi:hypothetical protein
MDLNEQLMMENPLDNLMVENNQNKEMGKKSPKRIKTSFKYTRKVSGYSPGIRAKKKNALDSNINLNSDLDP